MFLHTDYQGSEQYSEAAPDAKYAIYKHKRKYRVLQYTNFLNFSCSP